MQERGAERELGKDAHNMWLRHDLTGPSSACHGWTFQGSPRQVRSVTHHGPDALESSGEAAFMNLGLNHTVDSTGRAHCTEEGNGGRVM